MVEINAFIKQKLDLIYEVDDINVKPTDSEIEINIIPDTILMKSVLTTSSPIKFNSELNKFLGLTSKPYPEGTHRSEKPVMISSVDKVHLRCDCVDGSIVNGVRERNPAILSTEVLLQDKKL